MDKKGRNESLWIVVVICMIAVIGFNNGMFGTPSSIGIASEQNNTATQLNYTAVQQVLTPEELWDKRYKEYYNLTGN